MATLVSTSPPTASALSRHLSPHSSDDSSLYELSFDYTKDEDGNVVRVSKRRQPSISSGSPLPAIHYDYSPDSETPSSLPVNINGASSNIAGLQVPRRSS